MINVDSILELTNRVFKDSGALERRLDVVSYFEYVKLHQQFLQPTKIKIDVDQFLTEIKTYSNYFEPWGKDFDLPRYGLALVNQTGVLHNPDRANGSLMEWNKNNPNDPLLEVDFTRPTPVLTIPSLQPLTVFKDLWYRSNVFKLEKDSFFYPHVDTVIPSPWLRLWMTTDSANTVVRVWDEATQSMKVVEGIESGRVYLLDSSLVHDAHSNDTVYQLFLCLQPRAYDKIKGLLWK
jgi:hypothetical protein